MQAGDLPLHLAAEQQLSREAVGLILTAHPDALRHVNNSGCLPLDLAIEARPQADSAVLGPQLAAALAPWGLGSAGAWALEGPGPCRGLGPTREAELRGGEAHPGGPAAHVAAFSSQAKGDRR